MTIGLHSCDSFLVFPFCSIFSVQDSSSSVSIYCWVGCNVASTYPNPDQSVIFPMQVVLGLLSTTIFPSDDAMLECAVPDDMAKITRFHLSDIS